METAECHYLVFSWTIKQWVAISGAYVFSLNVYLMIAFEECLEFHESLSPYQVTLERVKRFGFLL